MWRQGVTVVTTLAVCSALIGLVLGIRFRFFALMPILLLGCLAFAVVSIGQSWPLAQALSAIVVFAIPLQVGYLVSAFVKHAVGPAVLVSRAAPLESPELR